jgi:hypothetical protein
MHLTNDVMECQSKQAQAQSPILIYKIMLETVTSIQWSPAAEYNMLFVKLIRLSFQSGLPYMIKLICMYEYTQNMDN